MVAYVSVNPNILMELSLLPGISGDLVEVPRWSGTAVAGLDARSSSGPDGLHRAGASAVDAEKHFFSRDLGRKRQGFSSKRVTKPTCEDSRSIKPKDPNFVFQD